MVTDLDDFVQPYFLKKFKKSYFLSNDYILNPTLPLFVSVLYIHILLRREKMGNHLMHTSHSCYFIKKYSVYFRSKVNCLPWGTRRP